MTPSYTDRNGVRQTVCPTCGNEVEAGLCRLRAPLRPCIATPTLELPDRGEMSRCPETAMCGEDYCEAHLDWALR